MKAPIALVMLLFICSSAPGFEPSVADMGDVVIVRGAIVGCPCFPGILSHQEVIMARRLSCFALSRY